MLCPQTFKWHQATALHQATAQTTSERALSSPPLYRLPELQAITIYHTLIPSIICQPLLGELQECRGFVFVYYSIPKYQNAWDVAGSHKYLLKNFNIIKNTHRNKNLSIKLLECSKEGSKKTKINTDNWKLWVEKKKKALEFRKSSLPSLWNRHISGVSLVQTHIFYVRLLRIFEILNIREIN